MQAAVLLYEGFTPLDAIGPYQVLAAMPGCAPVFAAEQAGPVGSDSSCEIVASLPLSDVGHPDIVVVPGSLTTFTAMMQRRAVLDWLRDVSVTARYVTSVCTGSLLLAAAGLLQGRPATTHWAARELLADLGVTVIPERVVEAGPVITAAGVSAGIDLGLRLVRRLHGDATARAVQLAIEYDPAPELGGGSAATADALTRQAVLAGLAARGADWLPR